MENLFRKLERIDEREWSKTRTPAQEAAYWVRVLVVVSLVFVAFSYFLVTERWGGEFELAVAVRCVALSIATALPVSCILWIVVRMGESNKKADSRQLTKRETRNLNIALIACMLVIVLTMYVFWMNPAVLLS